MNETLEARPSKTPEIVALVERPAAVVRVDASLGDFPGRIGEAFRLSAEAIAACGAKIAGMPFARYLEFGAKIVAEAGFPFAGPFEPTDRVTRTTLPGGRAVTTIHVGPYEALAGAWDRATAWMGEQGLKAAGAPWECYLTGPEEPGPPVTEIFWPIE